MRFAPRIAAVLWWLGTLTIALGAASALIQVRARAQCPDLLTQQARAEAQYKKYASDHPGRNSFELAVRNPVTWPDPQMVEECRQSPDWLGAGLFLFLGAALWVLAFVLGGRFWLPPAAASP